MKKRLWLPLLCLVLTGCQEAEKPETALAAGTGHRSGAEAFVRFCVAEYPALTDQDMPRHGGGPGGHHRPLRPGRGRGLGRHGPGAGRGSLRPIPAAAGEYHPWSRRTDTTMREIVTDEAAYFFAGERTAEEDRSPDPAAGEPVPAGAAGGAVEACIAEPGAGL